MRLVSLATSTAFLAYNIVQIGEVKKPLMQYLKQTVHEVAKFALSSIPYVSVLVSNYDLISEVLTEVQRHIISYEKRSSASSEYQRNSKEIGKFFTDRLEPLLGMREPNNVWDVHHIDFKKFSFDEVDELLKKVYEHTEDPELFQAQVAQILSKRLVSECWNEMHEGFGIEIPIIDEKGNKKLVSYVLDQKFDLFQDIPAFGFKDLHNKEAPILIFRCTNPNTNFADSWPSLLANLHPKGPAWKLYEQSHERIEDWLQNATGDGRVKARLMGYSQGSALASYFLTYKANWISQKENEASYLFAGPGISKAVYEDWKKLTHPPKVHQYVTRGDLVPKVGEGFIGRVFETSDGRRLSPAEAHRALSLLSPRFKCREVDVSKELQSSIRRAFSYVQKNASHYFYPALRTLIIPKIQQVFYDVHFSS